MIPIIKTELSFGMLIKRMLTKRIIVHHSASHDVPAAIIHDWHLQRGWNGIGYHFVIRQNGDIEEGRPLDAVGAHASSFANADSIGICLTGNFMQSKPSEEQLASLADLVKYLRELYHSELKILRHKDVNHTLCPGDFFPWPESEWLSSEELGGEGNTGESWKSKLIAEALRKGLISERHNPDETASKWFVLAVGLNILKGVKGKN